MAAERVIPIMLPTTQPMADVTDGVVSEHNRAEEASMSATSGMTSLRGTSVRLSVPLDSKPSMVPQRRLLRRDSLDRREALLKGKEGSRQRRRWENDRLLNNPHVEPPLPSDWLIGPTYPVRRIPYYLAPLWDAAEFQRAVESKLKGRRNTRSGKRKQRSGSTILGVSPFEDAASSIPKEVRSRLKHARSAKGLLQDLEENVRSFLVQWNEKERRLRVEGLHDAPEQTLELSVRTRTASCTPSTSKQEKKRFKRNDSAVASDTESEAEFVEHDQTGETEDEDDIVFVGRQGQVMHDSPARVKREQQENLLTEKLVFEGLESDKGAGFGRWLTHCIGSYYGLRTWSLTTKGITLDGEPGDMRQAYVGIDARVRGWMGKGWEMGREFELPQPLWSMM